MEAIGLLTSGAAFGSLLTLITLKVWRRSGTTRARRRGAAR